MFRQGEAPVQWELATGLSPMEVTQDSQAGGCSPLQGAFAPAGAAVLLPAQLGEPGPPAAAPFLSEMETAYFGCGLWGGAWGWGALAALAEENGVPSQPMQCRSRSSCETERHPTPALCDGRGGAISSLRPQRPSL